jgi:DivIVA domain-containing protein
MSIPSLAMDMTAQELRDIDIRDSFRGYHRDDVDDLLERAAVTIEHLEQQIRALQERRVPQAAPATPPPGEADPRPLPHSDDNLIERTLVLAQKAADEAVADAQARAAQLLDDSEAKAQAMVHDAEETSRRIAETEQRRAEAEISRLDAERNALSADVEALERFASDYRDRIRRAFEDDFGRLAASPSIEAPSPRPDLQAGNGRPAVEHGNGAHDRTLEPAGRHSG